MMWIRSQNETALIWATNITLMPEDETGERGIICYYPPNEYQVMGRYKDEETALLVLNQVMEAIEEGKKTFNMPKDEEG